MVWVLGFRWRMRVLIAVDKFKGSLPALAVAEAVAAGLRAGGLDWEVDLCPIADGGEGTTEAVVGALKGQWVEVAAADALGRELNVRYGLVSGGGAAWEAVMEMSSASGLALVTDAPLQPLVASSFGTGQMLKDAAARGVKRVRIGIGGSATNEGGIGLALALGFRFINKEGEAVTALPERFEEVVRIERPLMGMSLPEVEVEVACDVDNPLLGERGATRVYGRQKGVTAETEAFFEARLERLAAMVARDLGVDPRDVPGAGAAGGLGFGLMVFCGARLVGGFDLVAEVVGLRERMTKADVVITGEGRMDAQTLCGKGPVGVARMARRLGKRVVGIAGGVERGVGLESEFDLLAATKPETMPLVEAMSRGAGLIEETVVRLADVLREW